MYVPNKKRVRHSKLLAFWAVVLCVASLSSIGFASWVAEEGTSNSTPNINVEVGEIDEALSLYTGFGDGGFKTFYYYEDGILATKNSGRYVDEAEVGVYMRLNFAYFDLVNLSSINMQCTISVNDSALSTIDSSSYSYFYSTEGAAVSVNNFGSNSLYSKHESKGTNKKMNFTLSNLDDGGTYDWYQMNYAYIRVLYKYTGIDAITSNPLNITYKFEMTGVN